MTPKQRGVLILVLVLTGFAMAITGQIVFDSAITDPGANWGSVIGFTGIFLAIGTLVYFFISGGKKK